MKKHRPRTSPPHARTERRGVRHGDAEPPGPSGAAACVPGEDVLHVGGVAGTIQCVLDRHSQITSRPDLHHLSALFGSHEHRMSVSWVHSQIRPPTDRSTWHRPTLPQHHTRAELKLHLPCPCPARSPSPRWLCRIRQLHEQRFGICCIHRWRRAKLAPPHVERSERQSPGRAELASGPTRALEPPDQLSPLRGGAPRTMSRTACPSHDFARLRVGGMASESDGALEQNNGLFCRLRMEECLEVPSVSHADQAASVLSTGFQDQDRLIEESSKIERGRTQEHVGKHGVLVGMRSRGYQLTRVA